LKQDQALAYILLFLPLDTASWSVSVTAVRFTCDSEEMNLFSLLVPSIFRMQSIQASNTLNYVCWDAGFLDLCIT